MVIFRKASALSAHLARLRSRGQRSGFVPTMGALHEGHISLIRQAKQEADFVVCSIFVNPTQFNDPSDFARYPITTENDLSLLLLAENDIVFLPTVEEIYPPGMVRRHYDLGYLETILEGKYRPGHFQGVCQVIDRFLQVVQPDLFYLGQKDYQQCMVVGKLIGLLGLEDKVRLRIAPTRREADGLAMSSRNVRLSAAERTEATSIYRALSGIREQLNKQPFPLLLSGAVSALEKDGFRVDYVSIASANDLRPVENLESGEPLVALAAAFLGEVRLIDNLLLDKRS
ncbi:MAG: pantoate--beta-alanine ligase [Chitinophagaceae bacterium]|nr:MAG: pantoate--beta-alanine ligase [Chitinophagaceae bacterium]